LNTSWFPGSLIFFFFTSVQNWMQFWQVEENELIYTSSKIHFNIFLITKSAISFLSMILTNQNFVQFCLYQLP